jgi:hypothetical protein
MNKINLILLYLDPGAGSMLIQFLIASVFGTILFFKQITQIVKNIFIRLFRKNSKEEK